MMPEIDLLETMEDAIFQQTGELQFTEVELVSLEPPGEGQQVQIPPGGQHRRLFIVSGSGCHRHAPQL